MSAGKHHIKLRWFGVILTFSIEDDIRQAMYKHLTFLKSSEVEAIISALVTAWNINEERRLKSINGAGTE